MDVSDEDSYQNSCCHWIWDTYEAEQDAEYPFSINSLPCYNQMIFQSTPKTRLREPYSLLILMVNSVH